MGEDEGAGAWYDDLRVDAAVQEFLSRIMSAAERDELDLPHIVVCQDVETGAVSYSGPFRDGLDALVFAEREAVVDRELNDAEALSFSVAALYPADRPAS